MNTLYATQAANDHCSPVIEQLSTAYEEASIRHQMWMALYEQWQLPMFRARAEMSALKMRQLNEQLVSAMNAQKEEESIVEATNCKVFGTVR